MRSLSLLFGVVAVEAFVAPVHELRGPRRAATELAALPPLFDSLIAAQTSSPAPPTLLEVQQALTINQVYLGVVVIVVTLILKTDVSTLKNDVSELKTDVSTLKNDVSELKTDVSTLKNDVGWLKRGGSIVAGIFIAVINKELLPQNPPLLKLFAASASEETSTLQAPPSASRPPPLDSEF